MSNATESIVDSAGDGASRVGPRRVRFKRPEHPSGIVYGFLFRVIVGLLAVVFSTIVVCLFGAFSGWELKGWMLAFMGAGICIQVFLGEHLRSRMYERISARSGRHLELRLDRGFQLIDGIDRVRLEPFYDATTSSLGKVSKRVLDISLAASCLILTLPMLVVVATAIRFESQGPILFRQRRFALNGNVVPVLKFRTMKVYADSDIHRIRVEQVKERQSGSPDDFEKSLRFATKRDQRITRVGAFLRRTNIDELPQLINVLRGDMSMVGPRLRFRAPDPEVREYFEKHEIKPGLTGLAQVQGSRTDESENLEYDKLYVRGWSLWLDIRILLRSVSVVLRGNSAY